MGYELRMHVGETPGIERQKEWIKDNGGKFPTGFGEKEGTKKNPVYFMENSTVDLCKCGDTVTNALHRLLDKGKYCFMYHSDGDTKMLEDSYGDRLRTAPADKVLKILKENNTDEYRRFTMAIALLEVVVKEFEHPVTTFYGY